MFLALFVITNIGWAQPSTDLTLQDHIPIAGKNSGFVGEENGTKLRNAKSIEFPRANRLDSDDKETIAAMTTKEQEEISIYRIRQGDCSAFLIKNELFEKVIIDPKAELTLTQSYISTHPFIISQSEKKPRYFNQAFLISRAGKSRAQLNVSCSAKTSVNDYLRFLKSLSLNADSSILPKLDTKQKEQHVKTNVARGVASERLIEPSIQFIGDHL